MAQQSSEPRIWTTAGAGNSRRGLLERPIEIQSRPHLRLPVRGAIQASVVFDQQGTAFVADMAGWVHAFSDAGKLRWQVQLPGAISATPAIHLAEAAVFVGTQSGCVCALDASHGRLRWRTDIPTRSDPRVLSDLLVLQHESLVVLSSWGGRFLALNAATGKEQFSWDAGVSPASAAAATRGGTIYCLRAVSGRGIQLIKVSSHGEESPLQTETESPRGARRALVTASPVIDEGRGTIYCIFNGDKEAILCAWSVDSGSLRWRTPLRAAVQATPAVRSDGSLLVADLAGNLHAVSPSGESLWSYASGCEYLLAGPVCEKEGTCFLGDPLGNLHVVAPNGTGCIVFETERGIQARPSFDPAGRLFLPSTDRMVSVFPS